MPSIGSTVTSVILTFILTTTLNTFLNYFGSNKGTASVSHPITINNEQVTTITIENHTNDFIHGLTLEIPTSTEISEITSDSALKIKNTKQSTSSKFQLITVDSLQPRRITRIFIPTPTNSNQTPVRVTNPEAAGVEIRDEQRLESPFKSAFFTGIISALLYASILSVYLYLQNLQYKTSRQEINKLSENIDKKQETIDAVEESLEDVKILLSKQRLLLQARLYDYSKELSFWRNTIAKLLTSKGGTLKSAEEISKEITKSLKTFGTMKEPEDYEAIRIAADWIAEAERSHQEKSKTTSSQKKKNED